jgi:lysophospholipase L1-like esterase
MKSLFDLKLDRDLLVKLNTERSHRKSLRNVNVLLISNVLTLLLCSNLFAQTNYRFDFGTGNNKPGYINVKPEQSYSDATGYGFEFSSKLTSGADFITSDKPFYFSVKLPEGNYNVSVFVGDKNGTSKTTIKAECRRLMVKEITTQQGKYSVADFTVHVKDSLIRMGNRVIGKVRLKPREVNYLHWDNKLTLEFSNKEAKVCAIEIAKVSYLPTVFLAGNSTVVDQAEEPWASWGQMIPAFFQPGKIVVANYAESGETLMAFAREKRLAKIMNMARPGDYLFIEFAHNDQKPGGNHLDPFTSYKDTLRSWVIEARKKGIVPVLVTSTNRRTFDSTGHIYNSLGDYPEAMRQLANEQHVPLIDLNAMSKKFFDAMGPEQSTKAFVYFSAKDYPGYKTDMKDDTHFNNYGAYELAKCVVTGIKQNIPKLALLLKNNTPYFDPSKPDDVNKFNLPQSSFIGKTKPDGN